MPIHLRVTDAFGDYAKGDTITDADTVDALRNDSAHVVAFDAEAGSNLHAEIEAERARLAALEAEAAQQPAQE